MSALANPHVRGVSRVEQLEASVAIARRRIQSLAHQLETAHQSQDFKLPYVEFTDNKTYDNDPQCDFTVTVDPEDVAIAAMEMLEQHEDELRDRCEILYRQRMERA